MQGFTEFPCKGGRGSGRRVTNSIAQTAQNFLEVLYRHLSSEKSSHHSRCSQVYLFSISTIPPHSPLFHPPIHPAFSISFHKALYVFSNGHIS